MVVTGGDVGLGRIRSWEKQRLPSHCSNYPGSKNGSTLLCHNRSMCEANFFLLWKLAALTYHFFWFIQVSLLSVTFVRASCNFIKCLFKCEHSLLAFIFYVFFKGKKAFCGRSLAPLFGQVTGREYERSIDLSDRTDRQQTSNIQQWVTRQTGNQQARSTYLFCVNEEYLILGLVNLSFQGYLLQLCCHRPLNGKTKPKNDKYEPACCCLSMCHIKICISG